VGSVGGMREVEDEGGKGGSVVKRWVATNVNKGYKDGWGFAQQGPSQAGQRGEGERGGRGVWGGGGGEEIGSAGEN
jgi:hypothetical protein